LKHRNGVGVKKIRLRTPLMHCCEINSLHSSSQGWQHAIAFQKIVQVIVFGDRDSQFENEMFNKNVIHELT